MHKSELTATATNSSLQASVFPLALQGTYASTGGRDLCMEFIKYLDVSPQTLKTYVKALRRWVKWTIERGITQPTRDDVLKYRDELRTTRKAATVNLYMCVVRLFFRWLSIEGHYPQDIAQHIKGAKLAPGYRKDYMTAEQVKSVIGGIERDSLKGLRDYAMFTLMVTCGLRTVEVARANVEDLRALGGTRVLYVQGKGHTAKDDLVRIPASVDAAITAYLKLARPKEGSPLFGGAGNRSKGMRLTTRSISRIVKTRMQAAGYDDKRLTAHSLRHTAATLMLMHGKTVQEVQQVLRHKDITTTMIYSHNLDRLHNNGEDIAAAVIFGRSTAA